MGHIYLGVLPTSKKWQEVVALISDGAADTAVIAASARAAEKDLLSAAYDPVFVEAVRLLAILPVAARDEGFGQSLRDFDLPCRNAPDVFGIVLAMGSRLDDLARQAPRQNDFRELARRALLSTVTAYLGDRTPGLISPTPEDVHRAARQLSAPREFSAYARGFFTRLLGETLRYWLDRELANHTGPDQRFANARSRTEFDHALMQYSMEASRIMKEFAAGWFAKNVYRDGAVTSETAASFGAVAFRKISEEMRLKL
ncbi:hypothetical protein OEZ71_20100 [Defluviimonas sp. WL0050]|uniref:Uncharacterized protein n=1 Tax=Albidovulum litorale TaxID=2984134 RepID=A0ABT2ZUB0_9RHOB|nr:hypothetical protein [Defluviimonas sp. WL0050]MCV2874608.1 hypothetical protein [Defluviimonas sp. WL0050]